MTERGMLFSTPLVQAILAGRKTMTRRPVKPQPQHMLIRGRQERPGERCKWYDADCINPGVEVRPPCAVGDLLWVRETWGTGGYFPWPYGYRADGKDYPGERWRPSIHMPKEAARIWLRVTDVRVERVQDISEEDARAEGCYQAIPIDGRANDNAERAWCRWTRRTDPESCVATMRGLFASQWARIYGDESWDRNDFVWCISFERCEAPAREGGR